MKINFLSFTREIELMFIGIRTPHTAHYFQWGCQCILNEICTSMFSSLVELKRNLSTSCCFGMFRKTWPLGAGTKYRILHRITARWRNTVWYGIGEYCWTRARTIIWVEHFFFFCLCRCTHPFLLFSLRYFALSCDEK